MKIEELVRQYPYAYHMAETGTWDSIKRHGLLSTVALLDLFEIKGAARQSIENERRPESVTINHPKHGQAVIRDQKPMTESALLKCLKRPVTPRDWYRTLNGNVFFWLSSERLARLLSARAYRHKQHCVLTLNTERLVALHEKQITLCPINSGSTIFKPQPRGAGTFLPIADYPFDEWTGRRPIRDAVVELVVKYSVPNIDGLVLRVEERKGDKIVKTVLNRL